MPSKKHAAESLQLRLWRLAYAQRSFENVCSGCDYILNTPIPEDSDIYYPLVAGIYTLYARSFNRSNVIGAWTEQVVPKKFLSLHDEIMTMRHQLVAHLDADTVISLYGVPGNSVRLRLTNTGVAIGAFQVKPQISLIVQIRELAQALIAEIDAQLESLWNDSKRDFPNQFGEYVVDPKHNCFVPAQSHQFPL
jgi:hypothetical protein